MHPDHILTPCHSLKRGALSTGMERGIHPTRLKQLGRHKSYAMLDVYLELGDPFEAHPLNGRAVSRPADVSPPPASLLLGHTETA
jgi:hypothetical protein